MPATPALTQAWHEASQDEPPAALDDAIRAAARQAVHARPRPVGASPFGGRWRVPLSVAALLVVSATVTLLVAERDRDGIRCIARPETETGAAYDEPATGPHPGADGQFVCRRPRSNSRSAARLPR